MSEEITIIESDADRDNDNTEQLVHLAQASDAVSAKLRLGEMLK